MAETPILTVITHRATALVRSGHTPTLVEVGAAQAAALRQAVHGDLVPVQVPPSDAAFGPNFDRPIRFTTVRLAIVEIDKPDWREVR